jgi:hypothetical protein
MPTFFSHTHGIVIERTSSSLVCQTLGSQRMDRARTLPRKSTIRKSGGLQKDFLFSIGETGYNELLMNRKIPRGSEKSIHRNVVR